VIVVDNASTDATAAVARQFDSPAMPVRVVRCERRGKGAAVRAGVAASTAERIGFMDADGATDLAALADAVLLLDSGADLAIGSRAVPGSVTYERHSRVRALGASAYRAMTRAVAPGINDTQCGFKVMRGDIAREVFAQTRADGFSFDVEVVSRFQRRGARVVEFPVHWVDVAGSTFVPLRHGLAAFAELATIAWRVRSVRPAATQAIPVLPTPTTALDAIAEL
jgi:glycosyltransferase involved in cell wall biosynthesis